MKIITLTNLIYLQHRKYYVCKSWIAKISDWTKKEKLNFEKEVLGFYLSAIHWKYIWLSQKLHKYWYSRNRDFKFNKYKFGGRNFDVKILYDKNNPWSISRLECYNGFIVELFIFNETYIKYKDFLINDNFVYCEGEPSNQSDDNAFKVITKIFSIDYIKDNLINEVSVKTDYEMKNDSIINDLFSLCENFQRISYNTLTNSLGKTQKVKSNKIFISIENDCIKS